MYLSVVVPFYNEEGNVHAFAKRTLASLRAIQRPFEIIAVDDGSRDNTLKLLMEVAATEPEFKVVRLQRNFGQTQALSAGIEYASGEIIVAIDSDLENHPEDIQSLVAKIEEGYDVVSGWRRSRWQGQFITRKAPSMTANYLISKFGGLALHDHGCTLKAYRAGLIKNIALYGDMHRFLPVYAHMQGAKVTEMEVKHSPRVFGESKYGFSRVLKVMPDLFLLRFFAKHQNRPMHFFGFWGFCGIAFGVFILLFALALRFFLHVYLIQTPLPVLSALFVILGFQLLVLGILAEMQMRTYFESQTKKPYVIKERINF